MELAKRILKYRIKKNLGQKEMSKILDISNKTLCTIEKGQKVSLKTEIKIEMELDELERND